MFIKNDWSPVLLEISQAIDAQREEALAKALQGVPKIVIESYRGQFVRKVKETPTGLVFEYWMGNSLLVEEHHLIGEVQFTVYPQK